MKLWSLAILFFFISCQTNYVGKKEPKSLYINTTIPAKSSLEISTEDNKSFSIDGQNISSDPIIVSIATLDTAMTKNSKFSFNVGDNGIVFLKNSSNQEAAVKVRIYNHSSKVLQKTSAL
ncbi:hypothetical protein [Sphingobacterium sp.]|uniref:hypothetical protein n=1 Tax=Sphingobacterium sp. TaxID=341027 RepID=UPI0028AB00A9|nr:hypothetical protein [Sphingobacterium sp.]